MMSKWNEMNYRIPESSRTVIVCLEKCQINRRAERYLLCLSFRALYFSFVFIQPVLYPQSITSGKKILSSFGTRFSSSSGALVEVFQPG